MSDTTASAEPTDRGSALIITLMVLALVTALATTVATVTINNLQASWQAQQAGAAVNAADAGIDQAVSYLRDSGVRGLGCSPGCPANPWGNQAHPAAVTVPGAAGQSYEAWIETVTPYTPTTSGVYRVHSVGRARGSALREVSADVHVSTSGVPRGIFARTINGGGNASVARESIFSTGCVYNRSKIAMSGTDQAFGIPVAVHSSQIITDSNGTGQYCPTTNKPIHDPAKSGTARYCNTAFPYDQDRFGGGDLGSGACGSVKTTYPSFYGQRDLDGDGTPDVDGSLIKDDQTLFSLFGIRSPALTQAQVEQLRTVAQSQGNYWTRAGSSYWTSPDDQNAVMFFDLSQTDRGGVVDLNDVTGFSRSANLADSDPSCPSRSLIIVIDGGNVRLNSNQQLYASVFLTSAAPYGQVFKANGTSNFIGSIYADTVNLTGTADLSMDSCFLANESPALLDLHVDNYREIDR